MEKRLTILLATAALGLALANSAHATIIVSNGSFETPVSTTAYGPIDSWTQVPYPSGLGGYPYLTGEHTTGGFSWNNGYVPGEGTTGKVGFIQVYGGVSTLRLDQTVSGFDPGHTYQISYYESARAGLASPLVELLVDGNIVVAQHIDNPVAAVGDRSIPFRLVTSVPFTALGTSALIEFRVDQQHPGDDATAAFDGVTVMAAPEPATLSLLALGGLALLRRRRTAR